MIQNDCFVTKQSFKQKRLAPGLRKLHRLGPVNVKKLHVAIVEPHSEAFLNFNCLLPT